MPILTGYSSILRNDIISDRVTSCTTGRIFYFFQGRNSWNWTWSETYPGDDAFSLTLDESKTRIEKIRLQGSTWWIKELPVCVFSGEKHSLILAEINTQTPLLDFVNVNFEEVTICKIAKAFQQLKENSLMKFVCPIGAVDITSGVLKLYKSFSTSGKFPLAWETKKVDNDYSSDYIKMIVEKCAKKISEFSSSDPIGNNR